MYHDKRPFDINQTSCIKVLNCNHNWQVCLLDFTYKNRVPEYFVFRVKSSSYAIIDDYFNVPNAGQNT